LGLSHTDRGQQQQQRKEANNGFPMQHHYFLLAPGPQKSRLVRAVNIGRSRRAIQNGFSAVEVVAELVLLKIVLCSPG
jgi:hypothetical protein